MIIEIEDLKNSPDNLIDIEFNEYIAELGNSQDVTGNLTVKLMPYGINVKGALNTELELCCDRCLSPYQYKINTDMDEDFLFDEHVPEGIKEIELQPTELINTLTDKSSVDLTDIVYQTMVLELPTQNLCSENCKGILKATQEEPEDNSNPQLNKLKNYFKE